MEGIMPAQTFIQSDDVIASKDLLFPFVITEYEMADERITRKVIDERLNNRRGQYNFDKYLQHHVYLISSTNISTEIVPCGSSGYYKSELVINNSITLHYQHSFDKNAKYNAKYLAMNSDIEHPRYGYFLYNIDEERVRLLSLKLIVPSKDSTVNIAEIDLMQSFINLKAAMDIPAQLVKEF